MIPKLLPFMLFMMLSKSNHSFVCGFMQKAEQLVERDIHGNETVLQDLVMLMSM